MDATTILATVCCAIVLCGWLVLPHSTPEVRKEAATTPEPEPARLSA